MHFAYVTQSREKNFDIRVSGQSLITNHLYSSTTIFTFPQSRDVIDQNKLWSSFFWYISDQSIQGQKKKKVIIKVKVIIIDAWNTEFWLVSHSIQWSDAS